MKFLHEIVKKIIVTLEKIDSFKYKKLCWYIFLLFISTFYVIKYRFDIYEMKELDARNLIFILWIFLLGIPLFSEIEIGAVKLKKEIEKARIDAKNSIDELKCQIQEMKVANTNTLVVNNQPLPSQDELSQLQKQAEADKSVKNGGEIEFNVAEDNIYLFQVRLSIEKKLLTLCNFFQYNERKSMYTMTQFLIKHEVIDYRIAGLIREVINIANRGVHGEIIDSSYLQFVKETYPVIENNLDKNIDFYTNNNYYFACPRCGYSGPSKYNNICPKCGFVLDDD